MSNSCFDFILRRALQAPMLVEISVFLFSSLVGLFGARLPFVWDDWPGLLGAKLSVESPATFVGNLTSTLRVGWYLPISWLWDLARYYLFGYDPLPNHIVKALLLGFSALLLFRTMELVTGRLALPLLSLSLIHISEPTRPY